MMYVNLNELGKVEIKDFKLIITKEELLGFTNTIVNGDDLTGVNTVHIQVNDEYGYTISNLRKEDVQNIVKGLNQDGFFDFTTFKYNEVDCYVDLPEDEKQIFKMTNDMFEEFITDIA